MKIPNKILAHHEFATRKQKGGKSLDEFFEELKKVSKYCKSSAVATGAYQSKKIRDSLLNQIIFQKDF